MLRRGSFQDLQYCQLRVGVVFVVVVAVGLEVAALQMGDLILKLLQDQLR